MYETTIQANTSHMHILQKLAEQLQPFIQSHHGLLATLHIPTGKQLTFAVPEKYSALLQKQIRHYVACFICEEEKYQYFVKNIMFSDCTFWCSRVLLVSLDVEINPRFYRGIVNERSDNRKGELDASRKTLKREEPPV